jgi:2',3'-cyclic-nucleotide 2'-phosphodiesterase (5'-nucleotidase family)
MTGTFKIHFAVRGGAMPIRLSRRAILFCAFFLILVTANVLDAQQPIAEGMTQDQADSATAANTGTVRILYTGKLMGHFRVPDVQGLERDGSGCAGTAARSIAATDFDIDLQTKFRIDRIKDAILVGTGDNFGPELEARNFCRSSGMGNGLAKGKDLYAWDERTGTWVPDQVILGQSEKDPTSLLSILEKGAGTIPFDNAANFFVREGYAALVPGKHDFYDGPERLRELAKYLASQSIATKQTLNPGRVQMLGANLVTETTWKTEHKVLPDKEKPPWFIPRFPNVHDLLGLKTKNLENAGVLDSALKLTGVSDRGTVYPWFQGPAIEISGADPSGQLAAALKGSTVRLCKSTVEGDPNALPVPRLCDQASVVPDPQGDGTKFQVRFGPGAGMLDAGKNYGLCVEVPNSDVKDQKGTHVFCVRFSVYIPFFEYPANPTLKPYVLLETKDESGVLNDVAIFGVVDPHLGDYVGMLNLAWWNSDEREFRTQTAAKDPAEALQELLDYFDAEHPEFDKEMEEEKKGAEVKRRLIRVLLAEMSPQQAQVLATRVGKFQVVVSAADPDLATVNDATTTEWNAPQQSDRHYPIFVATPEPYYVANRKGPGKSPWTVDIGSLVMQIPKDPKGKWKMVSDHLEPEVNFSSRRVAMPPNRFWIKVADYLQQNCLTRMSSFPADERYSLSIATSSSFEEQQLEWLTACVLQKRLGADVVLLQKRDFFVDTPFTTQDGSDNLQDFLDRVVWKGDFLTLLYVPGSTLQTVMKQSKVYDADDSSQLSLADEKKRGFAALGIRPDPDTGEYFINEVPLDTNRVYAVATSDYIGVGDTGYPDLATAAIRPFLTPEDVDKRLEPIGGLVCMALADGSEKTECRGTVSRDALFDDIKASPPNAKSVDSTLRKIWAWSMFDIPKKVPGTRDPDFVNPADRVESAVERRRLGSTRINQPDTTLFAVDNAALNLNVLGHKYSDAGLAQTFLGNPVPQLSTKRSHTIGYDIQPKLVYSWHRIQLFETSEESYNVQYTGNANASRTVNQKQNLLSSDTGLAYDIMDRQLPHLELVGTFHYETQIVHPTLDTLAPLPKGVTIVQPADTARTHYLLPRVGVRYKDRTSWIEAGLEDGGELNAVRLIPVTPPPATGQEFSLLRTNILASGAYWKWHLVVPFSSVVSWTVDEDGDFFFNERGDSQTDTRFRSDSKTSVNFKVFPSLSFAPTYEFFYYANKVNTSWFWQGQASIQMKVRFDIWNRPRLGDQLKYKPSQPSSN